MVFSTVHRCKGMEYDEITLVNDFISKAKIEKLLDDKKNKNNGQLLEKLNEEINLLYVAVTRARCKVNIPVALVPEGFEADKYVEVLTISEEDPEDEMELLDDWEDDFDVKDYYQVNVNRSLEDVIKQARQKQNKQPKNAYMPWTTEDDDQLTIMYCEGKAIKEMANYFNRSNNAIRKRIKKLELEDLYG